MMFPITKPSVPDLSRYTAYLNRVCDTGWFTNFGPLHEELTERLKDYLGVDHLLLVSNGTIALQVAYRALDLRGTILTTPFSFIATTSSLRWEGLDPSFVDIDPYTFNVDPAKVEAVGEAAGLVAVHVYGNPCDVERLEAVAAKRAMPLIYDGAHAFGSTFKGRSLLRWGDAATLSFHATKLFHTVEGGAIVFRNSDHYEIARSLINFGQRDGAVVSGAGINGKLSEFHAAMGLTLLDSIDDVIAHRAALVASYQQALGDWVSFQQWSEHGRNNGAYMPVLFPDEGTCLALQATLANDGVNTRRYFHPSLNRVAVGGAAIPCPTSEGVAGRILCLPLYADLSLGDTLVIAEKVKKGLQANSLPS